MGKVTFSFSAKISTQGKDHHIHLPRRLHPRLNDENLLEKEYYITVVLTEIPPKPVDLECLQVIS